MHSLSLVIITKNEQNSLERCIRSVPFANEVLVVDSNSTDNTRALAEKLGARVISQEWLGFRAQKQFATDQAKNSWVLNLDADECLSEPLQKEIQQILQRTTIHEDAFDIPRLSWHLGRWIRHGGWYPDRQRRLYHREKAKWSGGALHEFVDAQSPGRLKGNILHYVFKDLSHQVITNDRYSTLGAESLLKKGRSGNLVFLLFRPWFKFLECYILKRGFLDGRAGFIIAVGAAYSLFLRYAKVWESRIKTNQKETVSG